MSDKTGIDPMSGAELPLDAIERRAKAMGWKTDRFPLGRDEYLDVATPSGGHATYRTRDGKLTDNVGTSGPVCRHDRALLVSVNGAVELLRKLVASASAAEAGLAEMRRDIEALQGLLGVSRE